MSTIETNLFARDFVRRALATPIIGRTPLALLIASVEGATAATVVLGSALAYHPLVLHTAIGEFA